jgi:hypothetical protein
MIKTTKKKIRQRAKSEFDMFCLTFFFKSYKSTPLFARLLFRAEDRPGIGDVARSHELGRSRQLQMKPLSPFEMLECNSRTIG